ncbi:MAG: right-handed parallel beta-helix repeat-containing protein [Planctomycetes bacterium]|nr:right-handed parallel beta-helix repeat-containing protein [Planctomycetota bacterium]
MKGAAALSSCMLATLALLCSGYASADLAVVTPPSVRFVDDNAPDDPAPNDPTVSDPAEDGSAEHPFDAIQKAVDAASDGGVIVVRDGIYAGPGNQDIDLAGKAVYLSSRNGPGACVIDCGGGIDNAHRGFQFVSGETEDTVVSGFTIVNGYAPFGGGVYCGSYASPAIINNVITGNVAERDGGGIACDESSAPIIVNNLIVGNAATEGGGMHCADSDLLIANTTVAGNSAARGGGIVGRGGTVLLNGCIVWGNAPDGEAEVALRSSQGGVSVLSVSYCDVKGGRKGVYAEKGCVLNWGEGNIAADPMFADAAAGDFHLKSKDGRWDPAGEGAWRTDKTNSPCVDTGDPKADYSGEAQPDGFRANMGAYANTSQASRTLRWITAGDANGDGVVDDRDMTSIRERLSDDTSSKDNWKGDLNRDGKINVLDLLQVRKNLSKRKK